MNAGAFERLHPALQYHIVNSLGWSSLRPAQLGAIEPILTGKDCLILAPTAGGKTEAAMVPVLSRILSEGWQNLSVLYVCPIKALLNNLEQRLSRYAGLVGRSVRVWHGDIAQTAKAKALREPPDILLTTPESLEGMLISLRVDKKAWFGGLRTAIIDELHAFAGDDRGWHLRAVLGRIQEFAPACLQRIGLSATVGNPGDLMRWLSGHDEGVIVGDSTTPGDAEVTIDHVGNLENAATVLSRLHRGSKRLVFCDSRARVEEVATNLRTKGVRTFVSHSSLSTTERRQAEEAFAQDGDCVIVATSTLELGIDVGDLDYVIQIDAPSTASSFLQRMGRTGRRPESKKNCLFLTTSDEAFLIACGVTRLWKEGYVEPAVPPPEPWHIVAQQAMALVLQLKAMGLEECVHRVARLFPELPEHGVREVLDHMLATDILCMTDDLLGFGRRGETLYGRRNFIDLVSTFASPLVFLVRHGSNELGYVDPISLQPRDDDPHILLLAGRNWKVTNIDWPRRMVGVEPSRGQGKARWFGSSRVLSFPVCQAIKRFLCDTAVAVSLSRRAHQKVEDLLAELPPFDSEATTLERLPNHRTRWWTFGGGRVNGVLGAAIKAKHGGVRVDDFFTEVKGRLSGQNAYEVLNGFDLGDLAYRLVGQGGLEVKFADCFTCGPCNFNGPAASLRSWNCGGGRRAAVRRGSHK
ncbi:MAG: DEAD/DEAH box helicase [bacterium]